MNVVEASKNIYAGNFLQDSPNYHSLTHCSLHHWSILEKLLPEERSDVHTRDLQTSRERYNNAAQLHSNHLNGLFQRAHQQHTNESCYINQLCN